jgi:hypothetical protein
MLNVLWAVSVHYHRFSQTTTLPINPNRSEKLLPFATGCEDDHNCYISQKRCEGILYVWLRA